MSAQSVDPLLNKKVIKLGFQASNEELERVKKATEIEREWWSEREAYSSFSAIEEDVGRGHMTKVEGATNYLPAMRFRNPKLKIQYPPYLEGLTKALLDELTQEWRTRMDAEDQPKDVRLAVANLTITQAYQKELAKSGKLAILGNPHVRGVAFDIDASAYYFGDTPVNDRQNLKSEYDKRFTDAQAASYVPPFRNFDEHLTRRPLEIFGEVLQQAKIDGKLNFVLEYPGTNNASYHICRNPNYKPKLDSMARGD